jgi:hypothetical protein
MLLISRLGADVEVRLATLPCWNLARVQDVLEAEIAILV